MQNAKVDSINKELKVLYGSTLAGEPNFRVVWSDSQFEYRRGTYNEFYGSIYLRTVSGVKLVPKYSFIKSRWVLERWFPGNLTRHPDLPLSDKGGYEPIYVFESSDGAYLEPLLKVTKIIICNMLNPEMNPLQLRALFEELDQRNLQKEIQYFEEALS